MGWQPPKPASKPNCRSHCFYDGTASTRVCTVDLKAAILSAGSISNIVLIWLPDPRRYTVSINLHGTADVALSDVEDLSWSRYQEDVKMNLLNIVTIALAIAAMTCAAYAGKTMRRRGVRGLLSVLLLIIFIRTAMPSKVVSQWLSLDPLPFLRDNIAQWLSVRVLDR